MHISVRVEMVQLFQTHLVQMVILVGLTFLVQMHNQQVRQMAY